MEKKYKIKAVKRVYLEIVADSSLSQQEIYEIAKKKCEGSKVKWEEPSFNIIDIEIDDTVDKPVKTKATILDSKES